MLLCNTCVLCVPGQVLQKALQLVTYQFDQAALNVAVGHVDHEDVGGRVGTLVVLREERAAGETKPMLMCRLRCSLTSSTLQLSSCLPSCLLTLCNLTVMNS